MADQIWYAWSRNGLRGRDGWQPRAVSAGIRSVEDPRFRALAPYLVFQLPDDVDPVRMETDGAPLCLTLARAGDERVLVHRAIVGARDTSGRPTVYFTHALAGLPAAVTAREVIRLWRSPFWQTSDERLPADRIELEAVALDRVAPGPLDPGVLARPGVETLLEPAIAAYCALGPDQRLYVAAPPDDVAAVVYGLTRAFPAALLGGLTFTTYQPGQEVLRAETRLVGTCWWHGRSGVFAASGDDLPARCYQTGLVVNGFDPARSSTPALHPLAARFARFAAAGLRTGGLVRLDSLVTAAEESNVADLGAYLILFRLLETDEVRREDLPVLLDHPAIAAAQLGRPPVRRFVLDQAARDPDWWRAAVRPRLGGTRRGRPRKLDAALRALAVEAVERAGQLVVDELDPRTAGFLLDDVAAAAAPKEQGRHALAFYRAVTEHAGDDSGERFPWTLRAWLLPRWAPAAGELRGPRLLGWLRASWSEIESFLALPLPRDWHLAGIETLVQETGRTGRLPARAAAILARHRRDFEPALADLLRGRDESRGVVGFYRALRGAAVPDLASWLGYLLGCPAADPSFGDRLLEAAALRGDEVAALVEGELVHRSAAPLASGWTPLVAAYATRLSLDDRRRQPARRALLTLAAPGAELPDAVRAPLEAWTELFAFLDSPGLEPAALAGFATVACRLSLPEPERERLVVEVVGVLGPRVRSRRDLRALLEALAPLVPGDGWQVLVDVARAYVAGSGARPNRETFDLFSAHALDGGAPRWVMDELRRLAGHPNLRGPEPPSRRPSQVAPGAAVDGVDGRRPRSARSRTPPPAGGRSRPGRRGEAEPAGAPAATEIPTDGGTDTARTQAAVRLWERARERPAEVWSSVLAPALQSAELLDGTGVWNLPELEDLLLAYLDALPLPAAPQAAAFGVMRRVLASPLPFSPELRRRTEDVARFAAFLAAPGCDLCDLEVVGRAATASVAAGQERWEVANWLAGHLAPAARTSADIGNLVETLGAVLFGDPWSFYRALLEAHLADSSLRRDPARAAAYLDYALSGGGAQIDLANPASHPLPPEVLGSLRGLVKAADRHLARHVDRLAADWPPEGRQAWLELHDGTRRGPFRLPWRRRLRAAPLP